MKQTIYIVKELNDWESLVEYLLKNFPDKKILLLKGQLGAGKTTLVQAFGKILQVKEHITSPTFSIMHEYHNDTKKIYHFDLYRLESDKELKNIGFEQFLYEGDYCFIEWPEIIEDKIKNDEELKSKTLSIYILFGPESKTREVVLID
ncbi:MAG: tRNA (adenosine(37)-N6)-threonylcarbamoyltransferase complex ATPase subunit type 1 TsaE [Bacteroidia bacterium]|nr:tRNA (adenosine(37)-N6)-threonylcarbamoyltransferase complex ATPase subunit type 1 TsaE [Bacteroidia bacterium]